MREGRLIGPSAWIVALAGVVIGAVAAWLVSQGNPGNMGLCIACFLRDTMGAFGGPAFNMGAFAYIRPEIAGIIIGAAISAAVFKEFKARGGSSTALRFVLGFIFMVAALIFLGCTVRAWIRLGGGDLNALFGVGGIVAGVSAGTLVLRRGFNTGRASRLAPGLGLAGPALALILLALASVTALGWAAPGFLSQTPKGAKATPEKAVISADGRVLKPEGAILSGGAVVAADGSTISPPESVAAAKPLVGGLRAPLVVSLIAGAAMGVLAQRSRFCSVGGIRDVILVRRFDLLFGVVGLLVGVLVTNVALGQFHPGFQGQPAAHTDALGNFASMTIAGFAAVLLGGCPFRQVVMAGEGDLDALAAVLGMGSGALFAHFMGLASTAAGVAPWAWPAMGIMAGALGVIAVIKREALVAVVSSGSV